MGIIDIHCHPAIKTYLFEDSIIPVELYKQQITIPESNIGIQANIPDMIESGVQCVLSAHYIPEYPFVNNTILKELSRYLNIVWKKIVERIEKSNPPNAVVNQTLQSFDIFEKKINNAKAMNFNVEIAFSYNELESFLSLGKTVFLHSLEGAHSLGRNLSSTNDYLDNLQKYFDRGVCMITLGHFAPNDLVYPPHGIPPSMRNFLKYKIDIDFTKDLSQIGEEVVRWMLYHGVIIDIVHVTKPARDKIFDINKDLGNKRPIVFSHSGVKELFRNNNYPEDAAGLPDNEELLKIRDCRGVIGIIMMNYWLTGDDDTFLNRTNGINHIVETAEHIKKVTGTCENISIGTDFDGMNDPCDDLYNYSQMKQLIECFSNRGFNDHEIDLIFNKNALRVLKEGWGKTT